LPGTVATVVVVVVVVAVFFTCPGAVGDLPWAGVVAV
jgi:hypothetical protein